MFNISLVDINKNRKINNEKSVNLLRMLPSEPSFFGSDGWQTRLSELFPDMASAPALTRNAPSGTLCRMMVQVLDQMESEIFFPVVNVRHETTGVVKQTVAVFRERLDDEEGEIVDPADFSAASERRVYKIGVKLDDHNGDKGDYKVALKLYDSRTKVGSFFESKLLKSSYKGRRAPSL